MIHHICRLDYDILARQVECVRHVVASHVNWLAARSVCLNADTLRTYSTHVPFDEWYASLAELGLDQIEQYRKLGEIWERMMQHHAALDRQTQDESWQQRFFLLHQHFFDLLSEFCQNFHMAFNMYDHLTRLPNRKLFDLMVGSKRMEGALVMADVDYFKRINDEHGHDMGDQVLQQIGRLFLNELEPGEVVARYGGEEFIFYFPATASDGVLDKIEHIRERVQTLDCGACCQTCSFGISQVGGECIPYKQACVAPIKPCTVLKRLGAIAQWFMANKAIVVRPKT